MKFQNRTTKIISIFLILSVMVSVLSLSVNAAKETASNSLKHYIGNVVNTGKDNGYFENKSLEADDPHYGWKLGRFYITGYSSLVTDKENNPIFLKNVGDKVALYFNLEQDIDKLNGKKHLSISEDKNGYDKTFEVEKQNFGKGTLIIRHTDYQNLENKPTVYVNYLSAKAKKGADTKVELFEEGDYEVSLDYEIRNNPRKWLGVDVFPSYTNYKIYFKFSVRNGNCMVYTFDAETNEELPNKAFTTNGFRVDLAQSHYLETNVKREILTEGADGLTEDTRFNRPAKDGDTYLEEGIYTITVRNQYTEQETKKEIYVGENEILKAHLITGLPIDEIKEKLRNGAKVNDDGTFVDASGTVIQEVSSTDDEPIVFPVEEAPIKTDNEKSTNKYVFWIIIVCGILVIVAIIILLLVVRKKKRNTIKDNTVIHETEAKEVQEKCEE